jgi:long-chain acyl-CoA synthetase
VTRRLLHDALFAADPAKTAIVTPDGSATYGELAEAALRVAAGLRVARGERVVLYMDNSLECAVALYAVLVAGAVFVVVNPQTKEDKLAYVLRDAGASAVVATGPLVPAALRAASAAPSVRLVVGARCDPAAGVTPWDELLAHAPAPPAPAVPVDLAALVYTSGSTGAPKGVMLTHQNMTFTAESLVEYLRLDGGDRILNVLPLAFDYGLYQLLMSVWLGATLVLEKTFAFPARMLERIEQEQVTVFPGVPTVYATLLGLRATGVYPSVRRLTNTAAALPPAYHDRLRTLFPNALIYRMYGLTECKRVSYLEPELLEAKPDSVGKAIPGTEALVLDEEGRPVRPGEVGILHVRGPHVMAGYWNAPEQTAHMLREGRYAGDRMLCTHDRFTVDEDGFLYFVGRTDEIIKTRGEKVSPVEVENALHAIDGVRGAAVVGVPDETLGEAVRAYVALEPWAELTERDLRREAAARLEPFMVPRDVVLVEELPRTDSGKVRKRALLEEVT